MEMQSQNRFAQQALHQLNRLPKLINRVRHRFFPPQQVLQYEPFHLHVLATPAQPLDLETFAFALEQLPTLEMVTFSSAAGDPLENPELFRMVALAFDGNAALSTVMTPGLRLAEYVEDLLNSPVETLVVEINGHSPSSYAMMTGRPAQEFITVRDGVHRLVAEKRRRNAALQVHVAFTVHTENYAATPQMLQLAQALRVDGVRFINEAAPDPAVNPSRTLYTHHHDAVRLFAQIKPNFLPFRVELPRFLNPSSQRNCQDPFTTVGLDGEGRVFPCSRLGLPVAGKLWEGDFWNSAVYQWLRTVHGVKTGAAVEIPAPCRTCPHNTPEPPQVISPA